MPGKRTKPPEPAAPARLPAPADGRPDPEEEFLRTWRKPPTAMSQWRQTIRDAELASLPDDRKQIILEHLCLYGRLGQAAAAAATSTKTVKRHREIDKDFDEAIFDALDAYRERVRQAVFERAVTGWDIPVFGGQFKDQIVGYERQYDSRLLAMEARRVDPEYREKSTIDLNVNAGVLLVPQGQSIEDWEQQQEQNKLANARVAELVAEHPETDTETKDGE